MLLVIAALARPAPVRADEASDAKEAFFTAEAYYRKGDYQQAIVQYLRAFQIKPHAAVLYNIAECFERLGQFEHATEYYERYLTDTPKAKDRAKVEAKVARFRALPSRVSVTSSPPGAAVMIDGQRRGRTPLTVELPPGDHEIEATYEGRGTQRRQIQCALGRPQFAQLSFGARAGRLAIRTSVEGVEVKLDGEVVGYTPYESDVAPGHHVMELTLYGYEPIRRDLVITAGATASLTERMRRLGGADQLELRRDGANPFVPVGDEEPRPGFPRRAPPPSPPLRPSAPPPRAHYTVGAFGGAQTIIDGYDEIGMGGFLFGIQSGSRGVDLEIDCLFRSPVVVDMLLRWYLGQGIFRPFFKLGMVFITYKQGTSAATADYGTLRYGLGVGGGLALDLGASTVLFAQVSFNFAVASSSDAASTDTPRANDYRRYLQVPIMAGLFFKL